MKSLCFEFSFDIKKVLDLLGLNFILALVMVGVVRVVISSIYGSIDGR